MTWRERYRPWIIEVIKNNPTLSVKELKKLLHELNPGQYKHMQRIWANESMRQLGLSKKKMKSDVINHPDQLRIDE